MAATPNKVVITGLGVLAANGIGKDAFWSSLVAGQSGIGPLTLFDASDLPCKIAGEVRNFDPDRLLGPELKARRMARFTQLGVAAARMAIADAGLAAGDLECLPHLPIIMGVSTSAMDLRAKPPGLFTAVAGVPHAVTSAIAYLYKINASLLTISDGCASSLDAVAEAARRIRLGEADLIVAGGSDAAIDHYIVEIMLKCRRCSTRNEEPEKASRPFDVKRDYGVIAEGAGVVILESEAHAAARGVRPYGEVLSYGACADPSGSPEGGGMAQAMQLALANAGLQPDGVDHISAHGPSDIEMDRTETEMIKQVFGRQAYRIPITSIKGATGCPMGAGGVLQLVGACLSLRHDLLPPTTNYEFPDPACDLDYIPGRARRTRLRTAMVNTHGFGRGNGTMILRRVDPR